MFDVREDLLVVAPDVVQGYDGAILVLLQECPTVEGPEGTAGDSHHGEGDVASYQIQGGGTELRQENPEELPDGRLGKLKHPTDRVRGGRDEKLLLSDLLNALLVWKY